MPNTSSRTSGESGQALVMVTLGAVFLFGILGLTIDVGYGYYLKQVAQAAVDSAALAAAGKANDLGGACSSYVLCQASTTCPSNPPSPPVTNFDVGCLYAKANGVSGGPTSQTVTLTSGSGNPPNVTLTSSYWVTATATRTMPLSFLRVMGFANAIVTAQATSAVIGAASGGCIWVLDPLASGALTLNGGALIQSDCGIHINSSSDSALNGTGGAVLNASSIDIVGGSRLTGGAVAHPTPNTGSSAATDPLINLPSPAIGGCNYMNVQLGGGVSNLNPGVYCGGIKVSAQAVVNFAPGTYILNGGGMQVTSSNATLNGTGVFFYNTAAGYSFSSVDITAGATVTLSPPTSGTYRGILLYQDRTITSSATTAFGGGSNQNFSGAVYLPTGYLQFVGGSATQKLSVALIAKDLVIAGNAYLQKDSDGSKTGVIQSNAMLVQ